MRCLEFWYEEPLRSIPAPARAIRAGQRTVACEQAGPLGNFRSNNLKPAKLPLLVSWLAGAGAPAGTAKQQRLRSSSYGHNLWGPRKIVHFAPWYEGIHEEPPTRVAATELDRPTSHVQLGGSSWHRDKTRPGMAMDPLGRDDVSARGEELEIGSTSAQAHMEVCLLCVYHHIIGQTEVHFGLYWLQKSLCYQALPPLSFSTQSLYI